MRPIPLLWWRKTAPPWWPTGQALSSARWTPGFTALSTVGSRDTAGSLVGGHSGRAPVTMDQAGMAIDRVGTGTGPVGAIIGRAGAIIGRGGTVIGQVGATSAPVVAPVPVRAAGGGVNSGLASSLAGVNSGPAPASAAVSEARSASVSRSTPDWVLGLAFTGVLAWVPRRVSAFVAKPGLV